MKIKKNQIKFLLCLWIAILLVCLVCSTSKATIANEIYQDDTIQLDNMGIIQDNSKQLMQTKNVTYSVDEFNGKEFFIKNMFTGQYLDVSGGVAKNGTNVQQYKYNGTDSQKWYMKYNNDGTFTFFSRVGKTSVYEYALDISNGSTANYANVQIWRNNGTDSQKFIVKPSNFSTFVIFTKITNGTKAVVVNGPTCNQGGNVDQYTYQGHVNEAWILEPVSKNSTLGVKYAQNNFNKYVPAYPDLRSLGGDCANFVSQCMLASGIHYQNDWYTYRKNENYSKPANVSQLDNTWQLSDPSPWISAPEFGKYWKKNAKYHYYKGKDITNNPSLAWGLSITKGDVVQIADSVLGFLGNANHTMYITDYENSSYVLTYHSSETERKNLLDICRQYPNSYFVFYEIM